MTMIFKELNCLLINKKITQIANIEWSEDDNISVISEYGTHIFKIRPNKSNFYNIISSQKYFLPVLESDPSEILGIVPSDLIHTINKESLFNLIKNPLLVSKSSSKLCVPIVNVSACWSPAGLLAYSRCVLCSLTNLGSVGIYISRQDKLILLTDISKFRAEFVVGRFNDENMSDYKKLTELAPQIHTNCIHWGSLVSDYCFLYTGHSNGEICVWKIDHIASNIVKEVTPTLMYVFNTKHDTITCIHTVPAGNNIYLVTGFDNGVVQCFFLSLNEQTQTLHHRRDPIILWPYIDSKVTKIISTRWDEGIVFIITKGQFVIAILLNEFDEVIETKTKRLGIVTGIQEITPTEFIVPTHNGQIYLIQLNKTVNGSFTLNESKIDCDIDFKHHGLFGMVSSKRRCLWGLVLSIKQIYDHNSLKNPSSITFCTSNRFPAMDLLEENPLRKLSNSWDCLETLRCMTIQTDTPTISNYLEKFDNVSTYELKILSWINIFNDYLVRKPNEKQKEAEAYQTALVDTVHMRHALERLKKIIIDIKINKIILNEFQLKSAHCLIHFLNIYKEKYQDKYGEQSICNIDDILKETTVISEYLVKEKCIYCGEELMNFSCSSNHPVTRCMISLVQIPPTSFLSCIICGRLSHPDVEDRPPYCVWCDGSLTNENYLSDNIIEEDDDEKRQQMALNISLRKKSKTDDVHEETVINDDSTCV